MTKENKFPMGLAFRVMVYSLFWRACMCAVGSYIFWKVAVYVLGNALAINVKAELLYGAPGVTA